MSSIPTTTIEDKYYPGDIAWMLTSTALVWLMVNLYHLRIKNVDINKFDYLI